MLPNLPAKLGPTAIQKAASNAEDAVFTDMPGKRFKSAAQKKAQSSRVKKYLEERESRKSMFGKFSRKVKQHLYDKDGYLRGSEALAKNDRGPEKGPESSEEYEESRSKKGTFSRLKDSAIDNFYKSEGGIDDDETPEMRRRKRNRTLIKSVVGDNNWFGKMTDVVTGRGDDDKELARIKEAKKGEKVSGKDFEKITDGSKGTKLLPNKAGSSLLGDPANSWKPTDKSGQAMDSVVKKLDEIKQVLLENPDKLKMGPDINSLLNEGLKTITKVKETAKVARDTAKLTKDIAAKVEKAAGPDRMKKIFDTISKAAGGSSKPDSYRPARLLTNSAGRYAQKASRILSSKPARSLASTAKKLFESPRMPLALPAPIINAVEQKPTSKDLVPQQPAPQQPTPEKGGGIDIDIFKGGPRTPKVPTVPKAGGGMLSRLGSMARFAAPAAGLAAAATAAGVGIAGAGQALIGEDGVLRGGSGNNFINDGFNKLTGGDEDKNKTLGSRAYDLFHKDEKDEDAEFKASMSKAREAAQARRDALAEGKSPENAEKIASAVSAGSSVKEATAAIRDTSGSMAGDMSKPDEERIKEEAEPVVEAIEKLGSAIWETVKAAGSKAVDKAREVAPEAVKKVEKVAAEVSAGAEKVANSAPVQFAKEKVGKAIGGEVGYNLQKGSASEVDLAKGFQGTQMRGLSENETKAYAGNVMKTESGGKLGIENQYGYIGQYQFGADALSDNDMIDRKKLDAAKAASKEKGKDHWFKGGGQKEFLDNKDNWKVEGGKETFLKDKKLQDDTFSKFTNKNIEAGYKKDKSGRSALNENSTPEDIAAYAKAAHLKGTGGANKYFKDGIDSADANGTSVSKYAQGAKTALAKNVAALEKSGPTTPTLLASSKTPGSTKYNLNGKSYASREELNAALENQLNEPKVASLPKAEGKAEKLEAVATGPSAIEKPTMELAAAQAQPIVISQAPQQQGSSLQAPTGSAATPSPPMIPRSTDSSIRRLTDSMMSYGMS